jgi:CRP-like cAMP-binding protein
LDFARLLDVRPDLGRDLDARAYDEARAYLRCRRIEVPRGSRGRANLTAVEGVHGAPLGFAVEQGMLLREARLAGATAMEVLGPGDLVLIGEDDVGALPTELAFRAEVDSRVLILDDVMLAASTRWPRLTRRLLEAAATEIDRVTRCHAIAHLPRADDRVLAMLWELAGRFGRVATDGVHVGVSVTHATLGHLIGARRPTVSLALLNLSDRGLVDAIGPREWRLAHGSIDQIAAPRGCDDIGDAERAA